MSSCFFNGYFGRNINCKFNLISLYRKKPGAGITIEPGGYGYRKVGYLSSEVKEASERVRTAIRNSGMKLPAKKIIVNLAPATVRKRGASFDLPIALAVLVAMNYVPEEALKGVAVIGDKDSSR